MTTSSQTPHSARNPDAQKARGQPTPAEVMQRAVAVCSTTGDPTKLVCSGRVFVGLFFDGTGNNEEADYTSKGPADRKHSNVVRLYKTYREFGKDGANGYYPYYIPGVGTPFPDIEDTGGMLGSGLAWNGEPRVVWGLIQTLNAVSQYVAGKDVIPVAQAGRISNALGGIGSTAFQRGMALGKTWKAELKAMIDGQPLPRVEQINVSVFGFSRGAAEARACINWLFQICEKKDGGYQFAGIPLRVQFMGLWDTVASVGIAGMYSLSEGRQSWADDNMQIHPGVEQCLHFVAAHEVRSSFPSDSVRIGHRYPDNVKEYVYPGAHSDVGGGYHPLAQGKSVNAARVPGFDMYTAALAAGVPLIAFNRLRASIASELQPDDAALKAFRAYYGAAAIRPGPVEEMLRQHMGHYFTYRWRMTQQEYRQQPFFVRASQSSPFARDVVTMLDTQQSLMSVLAGAKQELDVRVERSPTFLRNDALIESPYAMPLNVTIAPAMAAARSLALADGAQNGVDARAMEIKPSVMRWRQWLGNENQAEVHEEGAPERDMLTLIDALREEPVAPATVSFFNDYVHDSMAGFACTDRINEFLFNGFGIAKFRRIYFGDRGDEMIREAVEASNAQRIGAAKAKRAQRAKWDLESREHQRANPRPW